MVRGSMPLINEGYELTRYQIQILIIDDQSLPCVCEIGGRIPQLEERHVNPADGSLCLAQLKQRLLKSGAISVGYLRVGRS